MKQQIWKIRGIKEKYSDEELVEMIKQGSLSGNTYIATGDMKEWIQIKDSIYQFYLKEKTNETL
ncbi:MAG: DUF4339 domain-containing protein [Erysipelotrichaceae bacterium]|nr:DUF4339 domain-containing protein [Erysipelotrichaceae bacterium]